MKLKFQCWKLKLRVESSSKKDFSCLQRIKQHPSIKWLLKENFEFNKPLKILVTRISAQNTLNLHWFHIRQENRFHHISCTPLDSQPVSDSPAADHSSWVWVQQDLKLCLKEPLQSLWQQEPHLVSPATGQEGFATFASRLQRQDLQVYHLKFTPISNHACFLPHKWMYQTWH